jgi:hypothetical protein
MDKAFWQAVLDADGAVPDGHTVAELTPQLLANLGAVDPELRDGLAFSTLEIWMYRRLYTSAELWDMAQQLVRNLAASLGEQDTDSVFLRSFSALTLAVIVHNDNKHTLFEEAQTRELLGQALAYIPAERDLRGYVAAKGWAHAVAHGSDLLWLLARNRYLGAADLERILDAIAAKVAPPDAHIYLHNEDQRMVRAVVTALGRNQLTVAWLGAWLDRIARPGGRTVGVEGFFDGLPPAIASDVDLALLRNTTQFLRSLYFHLAFAEEPPALAAEFVPMIVEALRPMNAV